MNWTEMTMSHTIPWAALSRLLPFSRHVSMTHYFLSRQRNRFIMDHASPNSTYTNRLEICHSPPTLLLPRTSRIQLFITYLNIQALLQRRDQRGNHALSFTVLKKSS